MPVLPIYLVPILFGLFSLQVNWSSPTRDGIRIVADGEQAFVGQCLERGMQVSYRFKTRLCKRRSLWYDDCEDERIDTHAIEYDPISQQYEIRSDTHHDAEGPTRATYSERDAALAAATSIRSIALSNLPRARKEYLDPYRNYLGVRVLVECKGEGRYLAQIPLYLSLGLINTAVKDTGWIAFDLSTGTLVSP